MQISTYHWDFTVNIICPYDRSFCVQGDFDQGFFNIDKNFFLVDVQKADAGNLTCDVYEKIKENEQWVRDELVAIKSLAIQVRGKN